MSLATGATDPFVPGTTVGDDSLDPEAPASLKNRGEFLGEIFRDRREEVCGHWGWDFDNNEL